MRRISGFLEPVLILLHYNSPTMRELGVQVDMEIFTREYEELVDRVTSRC